MVEIHVRGIEEKMWSEFKEGVRERYGKLHTVLGQEVERALREYMGNPPEVRRTHTHQRKEEKTSQREESKTKIPKGIVAGKTRTERINNIGEMLAHGSDEISNVGLRRFIVAQGVGDDRVVESYLQTMRIKGWLVGENNNMTVMHSTISRALDIQLWP